MSVGTYARPAMGTVLQKFDKDFKTRADQRDAKDRNIMTSRATAYAQVNVRDRDNCRACFKRVTLEGPAKLRREHHHVTGRGGVKKEVTSNICLLCVGCHEQTYIKRNLKIHGNADKTLWCEDLRTGRKWVSLAPNTIQRVAGPDQ